MANKLSNARNKEFMVGVNEALNDPREAEYNKYDADHQLHKESSLHPLKRYQNAEYKKPKPTKRDIKAKLKTGQFTIKRK